MKTILTATTVLVGLSLAGALAPARADDAADWAKKCVADNKRPASSPDIVAAYCGCVFGKMSDADAQMALEDWEKAHADDMAACDKEAGWK
jgi:hypothetical protein